MGLLIALQEEGFVARPFQYAFLTARASQLSLSPLCGTRSKKNDLDLTEICPLLPILVSSLGIKLAAYFLRFRRRSLTRSFRAVIGTLSKR
jgi:hypothetical protein